jgi:oligopeptide/dipeptide ABC transporter ATP-binding protein
MVLRLERPTSGRISFSGNDIHQLRGATLREYRRSVQAVFQDPWSSLNPRMRAGDIVAEPLDVLGGIDRAQRSASLEESFRAVGLDPGLARSFPHEFSGGMRQRVAVARALSTSPRLIVLDEPVSALDVSIRAQIMNLLRDVQGRFGVAYLLIAHNLAAVRYLSHRVATMYLGQIVEIGTTPQVLTEPRHPYTAALISASRARPPGEKTKRIVIDAEIPSPMHPPPGCRFHTRCWLYKTLRSPAICRTEAPALRPIAGQQSAACHYAEEMPQYSLGVRAHAVPAADPSAIPTQPLS